MWKGKKLLNDFQLLKLFFLVIFIQQTKQVASSYTLPSVPEALWSKGRAVAFKASGHGFDSRSVFYVGMRGLV